MEQIHRGSYYNCSGFLNKFSKFKEMYSRVSTSVSDVLQLMWHIRLRCFLFLSYMAYIYGPFFNYQTIYQQCRIAANDRLVHFLGLWFVPFEGN